MSHAFNFGDIINNSESLFNFVGLNNQNNNNNNTTNTIQYGCDLTDFNWNINSNNDSNEDNKNTEYNMQYKKTLPKFDFNEFGNENSNDNPFSFNFQDQFNNTNNNSSNVVELTRDDNKTIIDPTPLQFTTYSREYVLTDEFANKVIKKMFKEHVNYPNATLQDDAIKLIQQFTYGIYHKLITIVNYNYQYIDKYSNDFPQFYSYILKSFSINYDIDLVLFITDYDLIYIPDTHNNNDKISLIQIDYGFSQRSLQSNNLSFHINRTVRTLTQKFFFFNLYILST